MEIRLRGVKKNAQQVKADLQAAFAHPPTVIIEDESDSGGTVPAVVLYEQIDNNDRASVAATIDTVLMRNGFVFCSVEHRTMDCEKVGGWPSLE